MSEHEQPDGDIHGERAAESEPSELSAFEKWWAMLSKVPYMSKKAIADRAFYAGETASHELRFDACRPHMKEGETVADAMARLEHSESFYRRRCEALQAWQSSMRNPERVIVCDILANGFTLDQPLAGDRYEGLKPDKARAAQEVAGCGNQ